MDDQYNRADLLSILGKLANDDTNQEPTEDEKLAIVNDVGRYLTETLQLPSNHYQNSSIIPRVNQPNTSKLQLERYNHKQLLNRLVTNFAPPEVRQSSGKTLRH
jgi:glutamate formiminotransferase